MPSRKAFSELGPLPSPTPSGTVTPSFGNEYVRIVGSPWAAPPGFSAVPCQRLVCWNAICKCPNMAASKASITAGSVPGAKHGETGMVCVLTVSTKPASIRWCTGAKLSNASRVVTSWTLFQAASSSVSLNGTCRATRSAGASSDSVGTVSPIASSLLAMIARCDSGSEKNVCVSISLNARC